jgi:GDP-L-fucose synthase
MTKLAIVFGTYNRFPLLQRAVASIRNAVGCIHYEIIAVDGGSTDGSRSWLASQPDVVLIGQRGPLTGAVKAFNLGFSYAVENNFDFVAHLNDDAEIVTSDGLERAIRILQRDSSVGEVAFAFDLYGNWGFDYVNGKPYANFGVIRREAGMAVAEAQGDPSGKLWWNPIYRTYGADSEFGVWLWKLGWKVHTEQDIHVHDVQAMDNLRTSNDALNPDRIDSQIFWSRWGSETFLDRFPPEVKKTVDYRKKVLVTGAGGFLGKHVVRHLKRDSEQVLSETTHQQCDLRDYRQTLQVFKATEPTIVYHLAARCGGIGANQTNPATFFEDNMRMGMNVLKAAKETNTKKVVLVGTVCSYPKFTPVPFVEDNLWSGFPEETNAPYGVAKRALQTLAAAYHQQYGSNVVTAILANLYGPGDNFDLDTSHVIPAMIRKFLRAVESGESTVHLWGDGSPTREFLHVDDAARALVLIASVYNGVAPLNIGSGNEISIASLAGLIAKETGFTGTIEWDVNRPNGQPRRSLDVTRAKKEIGFECAIPIQIGLQETIRWFKENK